MVFNRKGQSASEYAIILGLVIAVAAGVAQVLLKNALRDKQTKAAALLYSAGNGTTDWDAASLAASDVQAYSQELRQTTINATSYVDRNILKKGGSEERNSRQDQTTDSVAVETIAPDTGGTPVAAP